MESWNIYPQNAPSTPSSTWLCPQNNTPGPEWLHSQNNSNERERNESKFTFLFKKSFPFL